MSESKIISVLLLNSRSELMVHLMEYLSIERFECQQTANSTFALSKLQTESFDFLLVGDDFNWEEASQLIDKTNEMMFRGAILILTRQVENDQIAEALLKGADDVFVMPYNMALISARLKNLYQNRTNYHCEQIKHLGEIEISEYEYRVWVNKQQLHLTRAEFELLKFFMANPGHIIPHEVLATQVLRHDTEKDLPFDFLYSHIKNLKRKLSRHTSRNYIKAVYGEGYRFKGFSE